MANKTKDFGTLVQRVLENIQQSTADLDSLHAHRARQFLIDNIIDLQEEEFHFTQATGSWQTSSGIWSYDPSTKLTRLCRRPLKLWYSNSASDDVLYPANPDGLHQVDYDVVFEDANSDATGTFDTVDAWSWFDRLIKITPRPDGNIYLVLRYVLQPTAFSYNYSGGQWTYAYEISGGISRPCIQIDDVTDGSGWLQFAFQLIVARSVRDLYMGPYQAKDPKHTLAQSWALTADNERRKIEMKETRAQGRKRTRPYHGPWEA